MSRRRVTGLAPVWTERLGLESAAAIPSELEARLSHLVTLVTADVPPADSAAAAVAYGDLWALTGFLADAHRVLQGKEIHA
ncbi:hypothetical protein Kfla_3341 [Kribbella flavida DSM 17836]|uniref:Uncharacterized protein n=1 Tax=Kribbella flavida (strain DSM 17836 / JCM 10339 / NBRC 14399) TaxID=479435 RepID=D2PKT4_KRIFD|nr:hypothetical protein [Kribbella flavida]ADB32401.1 hypothetical protein Kfla_3341 [Kribbella flavida DSM 17836]